jgi:hypothetical protein
VESDDVEAYQSSSAPVLMHLRTKAVPFFTSLTGRRPESIHFPVGLAVEVWASPSFLPPGVNKTGGGSFNVPVSGESLSANACRDPLRGANKINDLANARHKVSTPIDRISEFGCEREWIHSTGLSFLRARAREFNQLTCIAWELGPQYLAEGATKSVL